MLYSRRLTIEEKRNKRKSLILFLLTAGLLFLLVFYGLPSIVKFASFLSELKSSSETPENTDTTPPPPPFFEDLPEYTKEKEVEIKGTTEPGATVKLTFNNRTEEVVADNEGNFVFKLSLTNGENKVSAISIDTSGNQSQPTQIYKITYDNEPPKLEIIKPSDKQQFFGSRGRQVLIEGQTEKDARVSVNGRWVVVDNEGKFAYATTLESGENIFTIKSEDLAGNTKELSITLSYTP